MRNIGIDAGGSLTKIAYEERGKIHVKTFPSDKMDQLMDWLRIVSPGALLHLTGGKSAYLERTVQQKTFHVDEFEATAEGTRFLLQQEKSVLDKEFILVSIGTGTSIFHVTQESHVRLFGSGIGGGTLMGLGTLICGKNNFLELVELAGKGNRANSDLLVKDIYAPGKPPLSGDLTAANFGKAHRENNANETDHMSSLIQLIGESIILLAGQAAAAHNVGKIVFIGSTLNGNRPLKDVLGGYREMLPYEPVFLDRGAYAGAIGAFTL
ncbi:type II pantothenate kinase [Virgibacillus ainsalahensis]